MFRFDRRQIASFDWLLLGLVLLIPTYGLIVLYSAGYNPDTAIWQNWLGSFALRSTAFVKQLYFLFFALLVALAAAAIPSNWLYRAAYPFYALCILSLISVALFGVIRNGSQRWFDFGPIHFQPSEMVKFGLILALARYLSKNPPEKGGFSLKQLALPVGIFLVPMALIMKQPDLGTSLIVGGIGGGLILFMGVRPKILIISGIIAVVGAFPAWNSLHEYQQKRISVLFNPEMDPRGSGYHITQSKIAVGSGGLLGKGFLQGSQAHLEFLPEHTTDFIFSVVAEEFGFIGTILVLGLYFLFMARLLMVVARCRDLFSGLIVYGVTLTLFMQIVVNIGMVIGLLPVVGIPLPLFSYGGSSLLSTMFSIGVVLGITARRFSSGFSKP